MDKESLHRLIERYYDADTTAQEERMLLKAALESEGRDPIVDEVLAVMGYARRKPSPEMEVKASMKRGVGRRSVLLRVGSAAASVAAVVAVGFMLMRSPGVGVEAAECYAYVDGIRIENRNDVASLVNRQLSELANAEESVNEVITEDFSDMSEAFNFDEL